MKQSLSVIGLGFIVGVGAYAFFLVKQLADVDEVCSLFRQGAAVGELQRIEEDYSLKLMGPFALRNKAGTQQAIFCASLTLCDTSCSVEFRNGRVTSAEVRGL